MVIVILLVLGLCFGSFVNALVWRVRTGMDIAFSRSQCVHCGHNLTARELVPVVSWAVLRGRCRYCQEPISVQYPIVELSCTLIFIASYVLWPGGIIDRGDWVLFVTWLLASVGLLALLVYDLRWMLLPNVILYPTLAIAVVGRAIYLLGFEPDKMAAWTKWSLSVVIASGLFWLIFMISKGGWIGYGDVRLGLITGTVLADPRSSLMMIFFGSLLGSIFVVPSLVSGHKNLSAKLPYGPFLIVATIISLLFGSHILDWYERFLVV